MSEGRATGRSAGGRRGKGDRLRSGAVAPRAAALRGRGGSAGLRVHGDGTLLILMNLLLIFFFVLGPRFLLLLLLLFFVGSFASVHTH